MKKFIFIFGLLIATQPVKANCIPQQTQKLPNLSVKMKYPEARQALIDHGWQPELNFSSNGNNPIGNMRIAIDLGYLEVDSCTLVGPPYCSFEFTDVYRNKLVVVTAGQPQDASGNPTDKNFNVPILRWFYSCENAADTK